MAHKKLYQVIDKKTGHAVTLSYAKKRTWLQFPTQAIQNSIRPEDRDNYYVEECQLVATRKFTTDKKEII